MSAIIICMQYGYFGACYGLFGIVRMQSLSGIGLTVNTLEGD